VGLADLDPAKLKRRVDGKAETLFADSMTPAVPLAQALQAAIDEALAALPIPKVMSYQLADGVTTVQFVRPAHALVALHGTDVVPVKALGLEAGRATRGHRFQGAARVEIARADDYEARLARRAASSPRSRAARGDPRAARGEAKRSGLARPRRSTKAPSSKRLTALVEIPRFTRVLSRRNSSRCRSECLCSRCGRTRSTSRSFDSRRAGSPNRFLIVSNMKLAMRPNIVQGNERVVRPRLATRASSSRPTRRRSSPSASRSSLATYHNKLGSDSIASSACASSRRRHPVDAAARRQGTSVCGSLRRCCEGRPRHAHGGRVPRAQGIMGKYYAEADGEEPSVVRAIEQHYWPRFSGDDLPSGDVSIALALADKLETLVGIWGVGQQPTGDKDPFGLRRAALGVLRILGEKPEAEALDLGKLLESAVGGFPAGKLAADTAPQMHAFMLDRLRSLLREKGYDANEIEAVLADNPTRIAEVWKRIEAVKAFRALPEAEALAAANKRIQNILRKSGTSADIDASLLQLPEEQKLHRTLGDLDAVVNAKFEKGDFAGSLSALAGARADVDAFFDKVLVNAEDEKLRQTRLGLLTKLGRVMNRVADISKLSS
jgi:glycyl-tRNA synthetase beta chain